MVLRRLAILAILGVLLLGSGPSFFPMVTEVSAEDGAQISASSIYESTFNAVDARASAEIIPARVANLSYTIPGRISEITVIEGDTVKAGQSLAVLDTVVFETAIASAEVRLKAAQAQLALLEAIPKHEDVLIAESQLDVAEAALIQAEAQRGLMTFASQKAAVATAEASVANANAAYQAALIFEFQQRDIDIENWQKEVNLMRLHSAKLALDAANAGLKQLSLDQISLIEQADLVIEERRIQRDRARISVDGLEAGVSAKDLAIAQARVEQAAVSLENARSSLASTSLLAPFDGVVTALEIHMGKVVAPGQIAVILADFSTFFALTTDLSERDVTDIQAGMAATIFIEAFNVELTGSVVEISFQPVIIGGDVTYPVKVALINPPPGLRWGMTAEISFVSDEN